jgi:hypothetical protein
VTGIRLVGGEEESEHDDIYARMAFVVSGHIGLHNEHRTKNYNK